MIALSIVGSATLLLSCSKKSDPITFDYETLMTESSQNRTIVMMDNGKRSYTFTSPLMEGYSLATNPYQEFRRGISMTTYTDTLSLVDATITANYAIYYERQKLWEAKGNVVIIKRLRNGADTTVTGLTEIYTQQLFWNATTKKIYSNVDTKVLQPDGWHFGVGFDADDDLKNIHFRKYSSEMEFDMSQPTPEERKARQEAKAKEQNEKGATTTKGAMTERGDKSSPKGAITGGAKPDIRDFNNSRNNQQNKEATLRSGNTVGKSDNPRPSLDNKLPIAEPQRNGDAKLKSPVRPGETPSMGGGLRRENSALSQGKQLSVSNNAVKE